jgi:hypothetical protein
MLLCVLAAIAARPAAAGDVNWTNPAGGNFTDGTDWSGGNSPGIADNAVFGLGSVVGYVVTLEDGQQISNSQLRVESDNVTLNFADNGTDGTTYTLMATTDSLVVGESPGDDGQLTVLAQNAASGQLGLFASGAVVGDQAGSMGTLTVEAATDAQTRASQVADINGLLTVGNAGSGNLNVIGGSGLITNDISGSVSALISGPTVVGNQNGSIGTATVSGPSLGDYGIWTTNGNADIAAMPGSTGTVNLGVGQWIVNGDINVGGAESAPGGTGTLNVNGVFALPGVSTPSSNALRIYPGGTVNLNSGTLSVGYLDNEGGQFNFNGGTLAIGGNLDIGAPGDVFNGDLTLSGAPGNPGSGLQVAGNTNIDTHQVQIDGGSFSSGTLSFSHGGSIAYNSGTFALTNSDLIVGPGGPLGTDINMGFGDVISVSGQTIIAAGSSITVSDAVFVTGSLAGAGDFNFNSGALLINGNFNIDAGQPLGSNVSLSSNIGAQALSQTLQVTGQTTIKPGSSLTLAGGELDTGSLAVGGTLNFICGTLNLTDSDLTVGAGGLLGPNVVLTNNQTIYVSGQTTITPAGSLTIAGGEFVTGTLSDNGTLKFNSGSLFINNGDLTVGPGGLLGANVVLGNGQTVGVDQAIICPGSSLLIAGGAFYAQTLVAKGNFSFISGDFTIEDLSIGPGGLLGSNFSLQANQNLRVSNQLTVQGGSTLSVSGGSPLQLFVNGRTTILSGGVLSISSPGSFMTENLTVDGELDIDIGGESDGDYDVANVNGGAILGGNLNISFIDSFLSGTGDTFDILSGGVNGFFTNAPAGAILDVSGRMLQVTYDAGEVTLTDIGSYLPEPSAIGLLLAVGGTLLTRRPGRRCL